MKLIRSSLALATLFLAAIGFAEQAPAANDAGACCATEKPAAKAEKLSGCCATEKSAAKAEKPAGCCAVAEKDACCELLTSYIPVSDALAADDLPTAKSAAKALLKLSMQQENKAVTTSAHDILTAKDIKVARDAFRALSKELTPLARADKGFIVMNCPMADADWVQSDAQVRNPYYGKSMLRCGGPKETAAAGSH